MMTISDAMIEQLIKFEGCRLKAYKDIAGIWTIGVGHTGKEVKADMTITEEQAKEYLRKDIATAEKYVNALEKVVVAKHKTPMKQSQFDAIVSLVYNCGPSAIREGTTIRKVLINYGLYAPQIGKAFLLWVKATDPKTGTKIVSKGLQKRRAIEYAWYVFGKNYASELSSRKITDIITWATS